MASASTSTDRPGPSAAPPPQLPESLMGHYWALLQIFPDFSDQIIHQLRLAQGKSNLRDRVVQAILGENNSDDDVELISPPRPPPPPQTPPLIATPTGSAGNSPVVDDGQLIAVTQEIAEKFPDADANMIYSRLERAVANAIPLVEERENLLAELMAPGPFSDTPKRPRTAAGDDLDAAGPSWAVPPLERQSQSTQENVAFLTGKEQNDYASLLQMFPAIDNKFLLEQIAVEGKTAEELVERFSQDDSYPKKADRMKKERQNRRRETLLNPEAFDPQEFLLTFADPERFFSDPNRVVSGDYVALAKVQLANNYPILTEDHISTVLAANHNHFLPAHRQLGEENRENIKSPQKKRSSLGKRRRSPKAAVPRQSRLPWPDCHDEQFFREVQFQQFGQKIDKFIEWRQGETRRRIEAARQKGEVAECPICLEEVVKEDLVGCTGAQPPPDPPHHFCPTCVRAHAEVAVATNNQSQVGCLQTGCEGHVAPEAIRHLVSPNLFSLLLRKQAEDNIQSLAEMIGGAEQLQSCPFCPFTVILDTTPEEDKVFGCQNPECLKESCRLCKGTSHIPLKCTEVDQASLERFVENQMAEAMIRSCPKCQTRVIKDVGCNHMTCSRCHTHFCYVCGVKVDPRHLDVHFGPRSTCSAVDNFKLHEERAIKAGEEARRQYLQLHPGAKVKADGVNVKGLVNTQAPQQQPPMVFPPQFQLNFGPFRMALGAGFHAAFHQPVGLPQPHLYAVRQALPARPVRNNIARRIATFREQIRLADDAQRPGLQERLRRLRERHAAGEEDVDEEDADEHVIEAEIDDDWDLEDSDSEEEEGQHQH